MKLTAENVQSLIRDCFYNKIPEGAVIVEAVMLHAGFHPGRLQSHADEIKDMLSQLPDDFQESSGGGQSFLNACMTKDGYQWGEHPDIDALLALGIATKQARFSMPKSMWKLLPGQMPYFTVMASGDPHSFENVQALLQKHNPKR